METMKQFKFDIEGQGQSPPKTIGILTTVFFTSGPNLVILELDRVMRSGAEKHTMG